MKISDTQYKNLISEIRGMREEVGRIDRDLCNDRQDLEDFKVQIATMKEEIKQVRIEVNANANKVKDKVTDALKPARKEVVKLSQEIKRKKILVVTKRSLLDFIKTKLGVIKK